MTSDKLQFKEGDPAELNHCDTPFHCLYKSVSEGSYAYLNAVYPLQFQVKYQTKSISETEVSIPIAEKTPMFYILTLLRMCMDQIGPFGNFSYVHCLSVNSDIKISCLCQHLITLKC